jgi:hypothetical protein
MITKSNAETRDVFTGIFFRSSYYAVASYFIAWLIEKMIMLVAGAVYGYSIRFDYEYLKIKGAPKSWDQDTVIIIYLFPLFIFAILIVWLYLKNQKKQAKPEFQNIFISWLILFFTYRIIGILPAHLIALTGIHHALNWLYTGNLLRITVGITSTFLFILAGMRLLIPVVITYSRIDNNLGILGWKNLVYASVVFPSLLCCMVVLLFFIPGLPKEEILGLMFFALPVTATFLRFFYSKPGFSASKYKLEEIFLQWQLLIILLVLIGIVRILLAFGLKLNWPG